MKMQESLNLRKSETHFVEGLRVSGARLMNVSLRQFWVLRELQLMVVNEKEQK
jgi:hypothetical protein